MNYQFFDKYLEEHGDFGECTELYIMKKSVNI